jgi:two-component system, LytTR family, response regulator
MTILLLEDEAPARARLQQLLARHRPSAAIVALPSVAQAIAWLVAYPPPELIIADIQLSDGMAFEIFRHTLPGCPVIFTAAHEQYMIDAMQRDGIAYLRKPVREDDVADALARCDRLDSQFAERVRRFAQRFRAPHRLIARRRSGFVVVSVAEVAYFAGDDKQIDVVTHHARRFAIDHPLGDLEDELDLAFFRINPRYLVHATAVTGFRHAVKGKLLVKLQPPPRGEVEVHQDKTSRFRAWLAG